MSEIWTEDENANREIWNMVDHKGKSCKNCHWGNTDDKDDFVTCGHHHQNFLATSFCAYWTNSDDPRLKAYYRKRKQELKKKIKENNHETLDNKY